MKQTEIKDLSIEELNDRITEETQVLSKLVFGHTVSKIENPLKIRSTRRGIARLKTELHKRETTSTAN
jgi:large subunit ribosomal protein L29